MGTSGQKIQAELMEVSLVGGEGPGPPVFLLPQHQLHLQACQLGRFQWGLAFSGPRICYYEPFRGECSPPNMLFRQALNTAAWELPGWHGCLSRLPVPSGGCQHPVGRAEASYTQRWSSPLRIWKCAQVPGLKPAGSPQGSAGNRGQPPPGHHIVHHQGCQRSDRGHEAPSGHEDWREMTSTRGPSYSGATATPSPGLCLPRYKLQDGNLTHFKPRPSDFPGP